MPSDPRRDSLLSIAPEVAEALSRGAPIVALESTLLAHGLPADTRGAVALQLEAAVRAEGAVPATLAIIDHQWCIGLEPKQLARILDGKVEKASIRDLALAVARGGVWATTVASTMALAARAGIRLFATGGIGGVHRNAETTFDESADLLALARYPVAVVSAGAKSILDLPRTMERLETLGVPVIGFQTRELPAFYHGKSGLPLEVSVDTPGELAAIAGAQMRCEQGGLLIVQAPPADVSFDPVEADRWITMALARAEAEGVRGKQTTPYLLAALAVLSDKRLVRTNIGLVEANARLAARTAVALADGSFSR